MIPMPKLNEKRMNGEKNQLLSRLYGKFFGLVRIIWTNDCDLFLVCVCTAVSSNDSL